MEAHHAIKVKRDKRKAAAAVKRGKAGSTGTSLLDLAISTGKEQMQEDAHERKAKLQNRKGLNLFSPWSEWLDKKGRTFFYHRELLYCALYPLNQNVLSHSRTR